RCNFIKPEFRKRKVIAGIDDEIAVFHKLKRTPYNLKCQCGTQLVIEGKMRYLGMVSFAGQHGNHTVPYRKITDILNITRSFSHQGYGLHISPQQVKMMHGIHIILIKNKNTLPVKLDFQV